LLEIFTYIKYQAEEALIAPFIILSKLWRIIWKQGDVFGRTITPKTSSITFPQRGSPNLRVSDLI
jgi:hypothetical protein